MVAINGIVGDTFGTDLPQTEVPEEQLLDEKKKAKFSRTKEFALLKQHLEDRISFYQNFLPNGTPIVGAKPDPKDWEIANTIIAEFRAVIASYEDAAEVVKNVG